MKHAIVHLILFWLVGSTQVVVLSQNKEREEMTKNFQLYIENDNLKEKFTDYKKVKTKDAQFSKVLPERIKLGFILDDKEQVENDIGLLSELPLETTEIIELFEPGHYPPTEWERFLTLTKALNPNHFKDTSSLVFYHSVSGHLSTLLLRYESSLFSLEKLKSLIGDSIFYSSYLTDHYVNAMIELDQKDKAIKKLETAYKEYESEHLLFRLTLLYFDEERYAELIHYKNAIFSSKSSLLYFLAMSYDALGDPKNKLKALEKYARLFQFDERDFVYIKGEDANYMVLPEHLETIGDSYFEIEPKAACKYYRLAKREPLSSNVFIMEKYKMAIRDERKLQKLEEQMEEEEREKRKVQERINEKLKLCEE